MLVNKEESRKNPIRSTIGAIGVGSVVAVETAVNVLETANLVTEIAKEHLQVMLKEAQIENQQAITKLEQQEA